MGSRYKTFDASGIAPAGRLFAGDLNAIQDMKADSSDFSATIDLSTLRVGDTSIQFYKYGTAEARLTAALRTDGLLRGLGGIIAGAFSTAARDAIALSVGLAPYGTIILNTTTNQYEWNKGSDAVRNWQGIGLKVTYGTAFPTSPAPVTGDEHVLVDSTTNPTYQWRFRYNAGSAQTDKWEYVGGAPVVTTVATQQNMTASAAYHDVATVGPSFVLPVGGVFDVAYGFSGSAQTGGSFNSEARGQLWNAATAAVGAHTLAFGSQGAVPPMMTEEQLTGQPALRELRLRYYNSISGGSAGYVKDRFLRVIPVRCS